MKKRRNHRICMGFGIFFLLLLETGAPGGAQGGAAKPGGIRTASMAPEILESSPGYVEISREWIQKVVAETVYEKIPWNRDKVRVRDVQVPQKVVLPQGKISWRVHPLKNEDFLGATPLSVNFSVDGGAYQRRIWVMAHIEVFAQVAVTRRPLGRYHLIGREDVVLKTVDLSGLPPGVIGNFEDAYGKRTRRTVDANTVLTSELLEMPPLVKKGDLMVLVAESETLRITAKAQALQNGQQGENIRLMNIDSRKGVFARVVEPGTARVEF